ncbi:DUF3540 domain-containing protein [Polaromonas aquatica]|uniref:DUF3540 domain-containing protein n=1 Tax=Polaromonas aquatica TaxID=332657 RepID=UPI003D65BBB6
MKQATQRLDLPAHAETMQCWGEASIGRSLGQAQWRLTDGRLALQAVSCLLTPLPGDTVAVLQSASGLFVTHILLRPQPASDTPGAGRAEISVPGAELMAITQPAFELACTRQIALRCLGDVELTSASGSVSVNARDFLASASETMVQSARHLVTRVEHGIMQASALLRLHGRQALVTAEEDIKLDAERISLG